MTGCPVSVSLRLPLFPLRPLSPSSSYPLSLRLSRFVSVCLCLSHPWAVCIHPLAGPSPVPSPCWADPPLPFSLRLSLFFSVLMVFPCVKSLLSSTCNFSHILSAGTPPTPARIQQETCPPTSSRRPGDPGLSSRRWEASPVVGEWAVGFNLCKCAPAPPANHLSAQVPARVKVSRPVPAPPFQRG